MNISTITINNKCISIKENKKSWTASLDNEALHVSYKMGKDMCATLEDVKKYILDNNLFKFAGELK